MRLIHLALFCAGWLARKPLFFFPASYNPLPLLLQVRLAIEAITEPSFLSRPRREKGVARYCCSTHRVEDDAALGGGVDGRRHAARWYRREDDGLRAREEVRRIVPERRRILRRVAWAGRNGKGVVNEKPADRKIQDPPTVAKKERGLGPSLTPTSRTRGRSRDRGRHHGRIRHQHRHGSLTAPDGLAPVSLPVSK